MPDKVPSDELIALIREALGISEPEIPQPPEFSESENLTWLIEVQER